MEHFYFLFEDLQNWSTWTEIGYTIGFLILLISSLIFNTIYYLFLGRRGMRYATTGKWTLFLFLNFFFVFTLTLITETTYIFELNFREIFPKLWVFTLINAVYSLVIFFLLSLIFKRFSVFSKYIPVKF
jgi:hypothetical protein